MPSMCRTKHMTYVARAASAASIPALTSCSIPIHDHIIAVVVVARSPPPAAESLSLTPSSSSVTVRPSFSSLANSGPSLFRSAFSVCQMHVRHFRVHHFPILQCPPLRSRPLFTSPTISAIPSLTCSRSEPSDSRIGNGVSWDWNVIGHVSGQWSGRYDSFVGGLYGCLLVVELDSV